MTIRSAQAGDRAALAAIVDDFTPTVLGAAYGLCGNWDQAADIAQETFATVVLKLGDLREPKAFPGWLMAVVRSTARRQRGTTPPGSGQPPPPQAGPEEIAIARDDARRVRLALEALPPELRLPMVLHYFAHQPLAEIALLCDLPLSTVKQRMRVARLRLKEGMDDMVGEIVARMRPELGADPSDAIAMYTAMRSGDVKRVETILTRRPDLVDVREHWTRAESFAHRLPSTGGGTPLLRAVERGDPAMVGLLLARGADPDGSCTCEGGERPLWVAVAQRETEIVGQLLRRGADPNCTAFAGTSALAIAQRRGYTDIARRLMEAGASEAGATPAGATAAGAHPGSAPLVAQSEPATDATGIKAIDLWCPLPAAGLVHLTPGFGLGAYVLISELSYRAIGSGRHVVWTGFVSAPTDLGDFHHALAESDLLDSVTFSMADPTAPAGEQVDAMERGMELAGDRALLVVFAESGRLHHIDECLAALARRDAMTVVVAPLDGSVAAPAPEGSPYLASIVFDPERARRRRWPALSSASWSKVAEPGLAALAERARAAMSDELDRYLSQPFFVAEHVTGQPGETVSLQGLREEVAARLETSGG